MKQVFNQGEIETFGKPPYVLIETEYAIEGTKCVQMDERIALHYCAILCTSVAPS